MTEEELSAGADAVLAVAKKYGVSYWLSQAQLREIASAVIIAHDRVHLEATERGHKDIAAKASSDAKKKGA